MKFNCYSIVMGINKNMTDIDSRLLWEAYSSVDYHQQRNSGVKKLMADQGMELPPMPEWYDATKAGVEWEALSPAQMTLFAQYDTNMQSYLKGGTYDQLGPTEKPIIDKYNQMIDKTYKQVVSRNERRVASDAAAQPNKFDVNTGKPLPAAQPAAQPNKFDVNTGKPLPAAQPNKFDVNTGKPL